MADGDEPSLTVVVAGTWVAATLHLRACSGSGVALAAEVRKRHEGCVPFDHRVGVTAVVYKHRLPFHGPNVPVHRARAASSAL